MMSMLAPGADAMGLAQQSWILWYSLRVKKFSQDLSRGAKPCVPIDRATAQRIAFHSHAAPEA
jgi:hypothetical protein